MTREDVERRKQELQKELEQALANAQALNGAIQDCNYWLDQFSTEESENDSNPE